jgi:hypothetical protein
MGVPLGQNQRGRDGALPEPWLPEPYRARIGQSRRKTKDENGGRVAAV